MGHPQIQNQRLGHLFLSFNEKNGAPKGTILELFSAISYQICHTLRSLLNWVSRMIPSRGQRGTKATFREADLNEAARAADASREASGAVYGERLK
jgi:hypothetical protein